ncbi:hypothetical protein [Lederbergia citrea]|uniref:hypothetical protein n=1 Tax=Lederbergia citrea TaxID=2833581 RepID=UPI001BCA3A4E|nr:hypothetical protein [Lederbergia citrea]MBS4177696.1 hypothetical protein [Lederbergia citrea]
MNIPKFLFPFIVLLLFSSGCSEKTLTFNELYDGDLSKVEMITILDGSTGYNRKLTNKDDIADFLEELSHVTFTITNIDTRELNGMLFGVGFHETNSINPDFVMTTNIVDDKVFEADTDLAIIFEKYYEKGESDN